MVFNSSMKVITWKVDLSRAALFDVTSEKMLYAGFAVVQIKSSFLIPNIIDIDICATIFKLELCNKACVLPVKKKKKPLSNLHFPGSRVYV